MAIMFGKYMAIKSPVPGNDGEFSTDTAQAILAAIKSAVPQEHWPLIVCDVNPIAAARKILSEAFRDQSFLDVYVANIAMLVHDQFGITDPETRNAIGAAVMKLLFDPREAFPLLDPTEPTEKVEDEHRCC